MVSRISATAPSSTKPALQPQSLRSPTSLSMRPFVACWTSRSKCSGPANTPVLGFIDRAGKVVVSADLRGCRSISGAVSPGQSGPTPPCRTKRRRRRLPIPAQTIPWARACRCNLRRFGFIDRAGQFAIQPTFESARDFEEGLAAVRIEGRWGFIDTTGRIVIPPQVRLGPLFRRRTRRRPTEWEMGLHRSDRGRRHQAPLQRGPSSSRRSRRRHGPRISTAPSSSSRDRMPRRPRSSRASPPFACRRTMCSTSTSKAPRYRRK